MKKIIHAQLVSYFEDNTLFTYTQYGYRSGCSTEHAFMELTDRIYNHLRSCKASFAFDKLGHNIFT